MVLCGCKRRRKLAISKDGSVDALRYIGEQCIGNAASTTVSKFPLLDLPIHILCDILSRLPLINILQCRLVCKTFWELLMDPYFSQIHLARAPALTTNLILEENVRKSAALHFFAFDLRESMLSSCSSDDQNTCCYSRCGLPVLSRPNADFSFCAQKFNIVGSCNGLLCLYFHSPPKSFYGICNPILGECIRLPQPTPSSPGSYTYTNYSGFGYCPKMKQYKVISFMYRTPSGDPQIPSKQVVAKIHTIGSDSWRSVKNVPCPKQNSFDPFLNGALHWITDSHKPRDLISSFDLEREKFTSVPPASHFTAQYLQKVTWMNIGVLRGCLCMCYIYGDAEFEVWVMNEYGVKESWTKEFSIDTKFYCKLQVEDLRRPLKFFSNGDLWFISSSDFVVSFSPRKRTFRELRSIKPWGRRSEVTAHDLSFISLKNVAGLEIYKLKNKVGGKRFLFDI